MGRSRPDSQIWAGRGRTPGGGAFARLAFAEVHRSEATAPLACVGACTALRRAGRRVRPLWRPLAPRAWLVAHRRIALGVFGTDLWHSGRALDSFSESGLAPD